MSDLIEHPGSKLRKLGGNYCSEKELLAIIINSGTRNKSALEIAEIILDKFDGLTGLMGKKLYQLMEIEGIGAVKATQIAAVFELTRRIIRKLETA